MHWQIHHSDLALSDSVGRIGVAVAAGAPAAACWPARATMKHWRPSDPEQRNGSEPHPKVERWRFRCTVTVVRHRADGVEVVSGYVCELMTRRSRPVPRQLRCVTSSVVYCNWNRRPASPSASARSTSSCSRATRSRSRLNARSTGSRGSFAGRCRAAGSMTTGHTDNGRRRG